MFLKIMCNRDLPDDNSSKEFHLIECKSASFSRYDDGVQICIDADEPTCRTWDVYGNVYLLNNDGKTIDSFSYMPPVTPLR